MGRGTLVSRWLHLTWRCLAVSHGCIASQCLLASAPPHSCLMLVLPHSHLASCLPYLTAALPRVAPSPPACHSSWPPHLSLASLHGHLTSHTCSPHTCHPSLPSHLLAHPPLGLSYHKPTTPAPASQTLMFLRVNHRPPRLPFSPWPCGTATKGLVSRRVQQSPTEPTELLPAAAESEWPSHLCFLFQLMSSKQFLPTSPEQLPS